MLSIGQNRDPLSLFALKRPRVFPLPLHGQYTHMFTSILLEWKMCQENLIKKYVENQFEVFASWK